MSSISDMQQLLALAQQIMDVLNNTNIEVAKVEEKTPVIRENLSTFRQLERLALRYLVLAKRLGLPDDVSSAIDKISQLIVIIRMAQMSMSMLMASNPILMLSGLAGIALTAISAGSLLEGY